MNAIVDYLGMFEVGSLNILNIFWHNNYAGHQVEAGMSDAADVMRDLLRKGLQVFIIIIIIIILGLQVKEFFFVPRAE